MSARYFKFCPFFLLCAVIVSFTVGVNAQKKSIAVIPADKTAFTRSLAEITEDSLADPFRIADIELAQTVIAAAERKNLFNLSLDEAKNIGSGIGCDYFILLRSENLRRSSFKRNVYYEAFLIYFLVDARTGRLMSWKHLSSEAADAPDADKVLLSQFRDHVKELPGTIQKLAAEDRPVFDLSPYEINDYEKTNVRTPLPFRRLSPVSTDLAQHLRVEAVVDIQAAIDEKGYITQTKIMRWAGFGLDEEVINTVRKMNFRPAILNGKTVPSRFVLRYNFRIPEAVEP
jgi:TonB family protein